MGKKFWRRFAAVAVGVVAGPAAGIAVGGVVAAKEHEERKRRQEAERLAAERARLEAEAAKAAQEAQAAKAEADRIQAELLADQNVPRIILGGPTGTGKTTLGKAVTESPLLQPSCSPQSSQRQAIEVRARWRNRQTEIEFRLVDHPGTADSHGEDATHLAALRNLLQGKHVHGIWLVLNATNPRVDQTVKEMIRVYLAAFGAQMWPLVTIVFTHVDPNCDSLCISNYDEFVGQIEGEFAVSLKLPYVKFSSLAPDAALDQLRTRVSAANFILL